MRSASGFSSIMTVFTLGHDEEICRNALNPAIGPSARATLMRTTSGLHSFTPLTISSEVDAQCVTLNSALVRASTSNSQPIGVVSEARRLMRSADLAVCNMGLHDTRSLQTGDQVSWRIEFDGLR